jgi:hypothetical protein
MISMAGLTDLGMSWRPRVSRCAGISFVRVETGGNSIRCLISQAEFDRVIAGRSDHTGWLGNSGNRTSVTLCDFCWIIWTPGQPD